LITLFHIYHIISNVFVCVQQKKETHTGLEQHEAEQNNGGLLYPFKR